MKKKCIVVVGPTAVGKTDVAIFLATFFNTSIISADSRQCFKELNIGVAKPNPQQLQQVLHYFINTYSIHELITAADFEQYALNAIHQIFEKNDLAILVGGTGLYINAFCDGLDKIPKVPSNIRESIQQQFECYGLPWLEKALQENDPAYYLQGEMKNPQRMMRALEVLLATGKSILTFQQKNKIQREFEIIKIGIELPREILYHRISQRVDEMMKDGLLDEVTTLLQNKKLNALQTVGYTELFEYLEGNMTLEEAVSLIKQHTRNYAKRQMTWFKKDPQTKWLSPDKEKVLEYLRDELKFNT